MSMVVQHNMQAANANRMLGVQQAHRVQKRWLTTARTTFLHRLDSLCLHRQISLIRVYFLYYSNFGKFIFATEKESGNWLLFVMFYNERKSVEEQK